MQANKFNRAVTFAMNYIDFIILAFVTFFFIKGLFRGFFQEVFGLLGLIVALIFATKYMSDAAEQIDSILDIPPTLATLLGFLLIFFSLIFAFQLLTHLLQKIFKYSLLSWLEKLAGGAVGFLKGATILSLLLLFISIIPFGKQFIPGIKESKLYEPTQNLAPKVFNLIMEIIPDSKSFYAELKESFENLSPSELTKNTQNFLKSFQKEKQPQKNDANSDKQSH
ncbi:MAG: CvpA family protein [bacterium]